MYISHSAHAYHDKWSNLIGRIVTRDLMAAVWLVDEYVLILCKLVNMIFWRHKYIARNAALSMDLVYTFCKFIILTLSFTHLHAKCTYLSTYQQACFNAFLHISPRQILSLLLYCFLPFFCENFLNWSFPLSLSSTHLWFILSFC